MIISTSFFNLAKDEDLKKLTIKNEFCQLANQTKEKEREKEREEEGGKECV